MLPFLLRPRSLFVALVVSLPVVASGACGSRTACFQYSQSEYMVNGNSCPAQSSALVNFSDPSCPGPIVSVDGAGTFDGELCCYPVTYDSITPDCGGGGNIGTGGDFTSMSSEFTSTEIASVGSGTTTGPGCSDTCAQAFSSGVPPCGGFSLSAFSQLQTCAGCFGGGEGGGGGAGGGPSGCVFVATCADNLCIGGGVDASCQSCLSESCAAALDACNEN